MSDNKYGPSYSLYGVVCHAGGGPNSGHYFAHVKSANGQWFEMNDDCVSRCPAPTSLKNAYVLFYIRDRGHSLQIAVRSDLAARTRSVHSQNGIVSNMKKRKAQDNSGDGDERRSKRPFAGPVPTSCAIADQDNIVQATLPHRKEEPVPKSTVLQSLSLYADEDEDIGTRAADVDSDRVASPSSEHARSHGSQTSSPISLSGLSKIRSETPKLKVKNDHTGLPRRFLSSESSHSPRSDAHSSNPFRKDRFSKTSYRNRKKRMIM